MSSSGLIYAVIVGAWAAYLVPMWLRRQDELNEARPTERFSTAIRLLSGRAGMERRYAKDLQARSPEEEESRSDPDAVTDSVDVRAFAVPPGAEREGCATDSRARPPAGRPQGRASAAEQAKPGAQARVGARPAAKSGSGQGPRTAGGSGAERGQGQGQAHGQGQSHGQGHGQSQSQGPSAAARRAAAADAAARARRTKVLARRRRTTVMLFLTFTVGTIVAAVGGFAFLWAPAVPAALLSAYIVYLRRQERRRFTYTMDRRRAEAAARRLRERQSRGREASAEPAAEEPAPESETGLSALAADRRALVEQTDHAEWVDQQRERQHGPGRADSWDPVPVPLPTYVTAPVAPRAPGSVDLGAPDTWSSARSSTAEPAADRGSVPETAAPADEQRADGGEGDESGADGGRSDARRAASARRSRERGRTPLFDQYDEGADGRPRAANE
ncbi:gephyrin-like molybdotransferase receptor GlpR [Streptomyces sp. NPDC127108]|uniref:divisome protein SepX/GlpR n=1 Tax=Streptomyces sp. NPDC127108 TaxID=3345361 RepID=UPI0036400218